MKGKKTMEINNFVEKMGERFPSKLSTPQQVNIFLSDCRYHLRKYEGEVLEFAFHEMVSLNLTRTHFVIAKILKICSDKQISNYEPTNQLAQERLKEIAHQKIFDAFKETDAFKEACQNMIGWDVEYFIMRHGEIPENDDIEIMVTARKQFQILQDDADKDLGLFGMRMAIYKAGKDLHKRNVDYYEEFSN